MVTESKDGGVVRSQSDRVEESMEKVKRFEDLWIWQHTRELVKEIYKDFGAGAGSKDFGFRDQIQKAGLSVMNNIAEGFERSTDAEFARFLDIAKGSCGEVRSLYYAAEDLGYADATTADARRVKTRQISAGIASLALHLRTGE
jgi:four helix bundle protein